jgi:hypothetical protein
MQLPYELLWGVDVAIKKLRPNANFQLEGTRFTQWTCSDGSQAPTWEEVMAQLRADEEAANKWLAENTQSE